MARTFGVGSFPVCAMVTQPLLGPSPDCKLASCKSLSRLVKQQHSSSREPAFKQLIGEALTAKLQLPHLHTTEVCETAQGLPECRLRGPGQTPILRTCGRSQKPWLPPPGAGWPLGRHAPAHPCIPGRWRKEHDAQLESVCVAGLTRSHSRLAPRQGARENNMTRQGDHVVSACVLSSVRPRSHAKTTPEPCPANCTLNPSKSRFCQAASAHNPHGLPAARSDWRLALGFSLRDGNRLTRRRHRRCGRRCRCLFPRFQEVHTPAGTAWSLMAQRRGARGCQGIWGLGEGVHDQLTKQQNKQKGCQPELGRKTSLSRWA
jgi:hypothetical protein